MLLSCVDADELRWCGYVVMTYKLQIRCCLDFQFAGAERCRGSICRCWVLHSLLKLKFWWYVLVDIDDQDVMLLLLLHWWFLLAELIDAGAWTVVILNSWWLLHQIISWRVLVQLSLLMLASDRFVKIWCMYHGLIIIGWEHKCLFDHCWFM